MFMMIPQGQPMVFTANFDTNEPTKVAWSVYEVGDDGVPVLLLSPAMMTHFGDASAYDVYYSQTFNPVPGKRYMVFMAVYTDTSYTLPAIGYGGEQQLIYVIQQNFGQPVQNLVGVLQCEGN